MAKPSPVVRAVTYERDHHRCVTCGTDYRIEYQHRRVEGAGGRLSGPSLPEGVTTCHVHNSEYEGTEQLSAYVFGWKVRNWVFERHLAVEVPVFYLWERQWCRLTMDGKRVRVTAMEALDMMLMVYGDQYMEWSAGLPKEARTS